MNVDELIHRLEQFPRYREVELQVIVEDEAGESTAERYPPSDVFERQVQGTGNVTVVIR